MNAGILNQIAQQQAAPMITGQQPLAQNPMAQGIAPESGGGFGGGNILENLLKSSALGGLVNGGGGGGLSGAILPQLLGGSVGGGIGGLGLLGGLLNKNDG